MDIKLIQIHSDSFIDIAINLYRNLINKNEKVATENFFNNAGSFHYVLSQVSDYEPKSQRIQKLASVREHIKQVIHWLNILEKLNLIENNFIDIKKAAVSLEIELNNQYDMERNVVPIKQYF